MKKIGLVVALAFLVLPSIARADNTTCAAATLIVPDGSPHEGSFTAITETRWFRVMVRADRSYAIMAENMSAADTASTLYLGGIQSNCSGTGLPAGATGNGSYSSEPSSWDGTTGAGRWTMMTGSNNFTAYLRLDPTAAGQQFRVRVEDTTQINTFFSTYSGFNTFYRLANTTNAALTVRMKMVNDAGATIKDITFTIAANRSAPTRNTSAGDLNIAADTAGFTLFMHDGPPNALAADGFLSNGMSVLPIKIVDTRQHR